MADGEIRATNDPGATADKTPPDAVERPTGERPGASSTPVRPPKIDYAAVMPKIDYAAVMPKIDYAAVMPKIDYAAVMPKIDYAAVMPKIDYAAVMPKIDYAASILKGNYAALFATISKSIANIDFSRLIAAIESYQKLLPANLRALKRFPVGPIEDLMRQGVPVYGVPSTPILSKLLQSQTSSGRRDIIGRQFARILTDCSDLLGQCTSPEYSYERAALGEAIGLAGLGYHRGAQALAANVIDTMLWRWSKGHDELWRAVTRRRSKVSLDDLNLRTYLAMTPVHAAHESFWPNKGDSIPTIFNRHASLHRVSYRQYSKRNTAIAILMAASLVQYFEDIGAR